MIYLSITISSFTTVVKGGIMYEGQGSISVAGGDQMWLAINKTLLFEFSTDPTSTDIPCMTIDITAASTTGEYSKDYAESSVILSKRLVKIYR